ncbi:MAG TPA: adenylosuccinate lyase [Thermomicrobiaceae bacterium]|nr:adenylosuccinate lyase [Thermomicrobiaceae bacterium]
MIERYTRPAMGAIWSERRKIDLWLKVEIAVAESWAERGMVPQEAIARIRQASCDLERMKEIEREVDHDVIAFLRATGETVGEASRFIHLGLTSSDVIDTALALQMVEGLGLLLSDVDELLAAVGAEAVKHRDTVMIGRTHGVHAEPITFGFKLAVWYDELRRGRERLEFARENIRVGKVSGAVGTHANVPPELEEEVCARLGLKPAPVSTQIIQRDRHAQVIGALALVASSLDKFATEIRHLQRTEVRELEEPFEAGNQGSSAMPHKRNPHESERISGLARVLRGFVVPALEDVVLWHERDISNSSAERIILPDAFILLDYLLGLMAEIVSGWTVYPERMRANLEATHGAIYSQRALLALVEAGMDRQAAYKIVQRAAHEAWESGVPLRELLAREPAVTSRLNPAQLDDIFDIRYHLAHLDRTFQRLGLGAPVAAS